MAGSCLLYQRGVGGAARQVLREVRQEQSGLCISGWHTSQLEAIAWAHGSHLNFPGRLLEPLLCIRAAKCLSRIP